jgi:putative nucleotidyltransferase-like protein
VRFMNGTVSQPALDDQLLILCAHPAKHCWSRLEWVVDLAAFIQAHGDRIDWPAALDRAGRLGARRLLLLAIGLTGHLLRQQAPADIQASVRADKIVRRLVSEISESLCDSPAALKRLNGSYGVVEAGLLYMRTRERLADKVPYLRFFGHLFREWCTVAPNELDYSVVRLPPYLHVLYFAIRPMRLLWKYGGRLLRSGLQAPASLR